MNTTFKFMMTEKVPQCELLWKKLHHPALEVSGMVFSSNPTDLRQPQDIKIPPPLTTNWYLYKNVASGMDDDK